MTCITFDDLYDFARLCADDRAYIDGFTSNLKKSGLWAMMGLPEEKPKLDIPPPCAPAAVTAVQTTMFDNWPNGKFVKGTPNRYGFAVEIWDQPADQIEAVKLRKMNHVFKSSVSLMGAKNLASQIRHLRKPRRNTLSNVNTDYLDQLDCIARGLKPDEVLGMLNTNIKTDDSEYHRGIYYHPFQYVIARIQGGVVSKAALILGADADPIEIPPFVDRAANGKELGRNIVGQSRLDLCDIGYSWGTNQ